MKASPARRTTGGIYPSSCGDLRLLLCTCLLPFLAGCPQLQEDGFDKIHLDGGSGAAGSSGNTNTENSVATGNGSSGVSITSGGSAGNGGGATVTTAASATSTGGGGNGGTSGTDQCNNNNVAEPGEDCDGPDLDGADCESEGLGTGKLKCDAECAFDPSDCVPEADCGDNKAQDGEACDGTDLNDESCMTQGYDGGELGCDACEFVVTGCTREPVCDGAASADMFSGNISQHESRVDSCSQGGEGPEVSFTWTAPTTDCYLISVSSSTDTIVSVYADCSLADEVACPENGGSSQLYFGEAIAGTTYAIVVDGISSTDAGPVTVEITTCGGGNWGSTGNTGGRP